MANRHSTRKKLTAIDLFAGCGGLSEGLRQAGFRVIGAVEMDKLAAQSYRLNHPRVHLWESDIRNLNAADVRGTLDLSAGQLDLLAGCPPCQGFSTMRTLNGKRDVRDRRNSLTDEFLRFAIELAPRTLMMENVPGLADRRRFHEFTATLEELGYAVNWDVLDAARYGVPQRRRRLILLASKRERVEFASPDSNKVTVGDALRGLSSPSNDDDPLHQPARRRSKRIEQLIASIPKNGGSRTDLPRELWLECHKNCNGFKDVYGRMKWEDVAPTITGGCLNPSKGRFLHPEQNRAITAREAALLQGFPHEYQFATDRGIYAIAAMIGNALPPEFIRRHALQLSVALRSQAV